VCFGCCIAGPVFSLPLSEVHGRDPDIILIEEIKESCCKHDGKTLANHECTLVGLYGVFCCLVTSRYVKVDS
jgi:hypothetical protein